mgnify:CR=1 FL=1
MRPRQLLAADQPQVGVLETGDAVLEGELVALVLVLALADYRLWTARARPWHDWTVILLLLPYSLFRWDSGRRALFGLVTLSPRDVQDHVDQMSAREPRPSAGRRGGR